MQQGHTEGPEPLQFCIPKFSMRKDTYKRDLQKRPTKETTLKDLSPCNFASPNHPCEKRPTKETYKRNLQKRSTKEAYKRDLQKRPTKETNTSHKKT